MSNDAHEDDHDHDHEHGSQLSDVQRRVRALETILTEKGYLDPGAIDDIVEHFETKVGPHVGARVVARAWIDPSFKQALLADATQAIRASGITDRMSEHLIAVENTQDIHHIVVCTLCSCYPWDLLGLPPVWYKSAPYRSRVVREPRQVLKDFGVMLSEATTIRVWDSTAETRYLVLPQRPEGTNDWSEEQLATLVTRDSMIGTGLARNPTEAR